MNEFVRDLFEDFLKTMDFKVEEEDKEYLYFFWKFGYSSALVTVKENMYQSIEAELDELMEDEDDIQ